MSEGCANRLGNQNRGFDVMKRPPPRDERKTAIKQKICKGRLRQADLAITPIPARNICLGACARSGFRFDARQARAVQLPRHHIIVSYGVPHCFQSDFGLSRRPRTSRASIAKPTRPDRAPRGRMRWFGTKKHLTRSSACYPRCRPKAQDALYEWSS